ncbi:MAG: M56 family metallopeptidase [Pseudomonadota bacterium]
MMAYELIENGIRLNLILAAAIALVLALRVPIRRVFGARVAYALWIIPPLAAAMCFAPRRVEIVRLPADPLALTAPIVRDMAAFDPWPFVLGAWLLGAAIVFLLLAFRQHRFVRSLGRLVRRRDRGARVFDAQTQAGPAVVGAIWPKIVTPSDFESRYSAEERAIVLAHERAHLRQGDPLINALAAFLQCMNWFNPLVHVAARALRLDQELACDAAVMAQAGQMRRLYAEAMLKAHAAPLSGPLVCAWPAPSLKPLKERIAMLKRNPPNRVQLALGASVVALATFGVVATAWTAQPTKVVALRDNAHAPHAVVLRYGDAPGRADATADVDLNVDVDSPEFQAQINELTENAMRLAQASLADADMRMDHHEGMSDEERAQMERDIRANAAEIQRSALQAARVAMVQARVEMNRQRPIIDAHVRGELQAQARELREQERQLRAERVHMSADERSRREAEIEAHAQQIAMHAMSIAQSAIENAMANIDEEAPEADLDGGPTPPTAEAPPAPETPETYPATPTPPTPHHR